MTARPRLLDLFCGAGESATYLLLGHPAWPGNLSTEDEAHARAWYEEHRTKHPVYVDVIRAERERLLGPASAARPARDDRAG